MHHVSPDAAPPGSLRGVLIRSQFSEKKQRGPRQELIETEKSQAIKMFKSSVTALSILSRLSNYVRRRLSSLSLHRIVPLFAFSLIDGSLLYVSHTHIAYRPERGLMVKHVATRGYIYACVL